MPYLERAYAIAPTYVPGLVNLGLALSETGRPDEGLAHLPGRSSSSPTSRWSMSDSPASIWRAATTRRPRANTPFSTKLDPAGARALEPAFFSVW